MDFLENRPINGQQPASGKLLIAEPFLADPNFSRTVILVCEHSLEGTVGFILNRPTELTLGDLLPELYTPSLQVYQGGPVQMDTLHMLHRLPGTFGGNEIASGTYWGGSYEALQAVVENNQCDEKDLKLYVGYAGWTKGQLEKELTEGSWLVADPTPDILFETPADEIWKQSIKLLGKDYAYLANMPLDPQLN